MRHILKIFKRKSKTSQEPTQIFVGVKGKTYSPDYYEILRWKYIVDKRTEKIVDILRDVKSVSND